MSENTDGAGAPPARGIGPREGRRPGRVWPSAVDPSGVSGPTRGRARGKAWRLSSYGQYVPADVDGTRVEQRIVEAAALLRGWGGVTGWAALRWLGGVWFNGLAEDGSTTLPVPLAAARNHPISEQPGVLVSNAGVPLHQVVRADGLRVTTPLRSLTFEMRRSGSVLGAARAFAMAAYNDLVSIDELVDFTERELNAKTGVGTVRAAIPFLTENAWSPMEPEMLHLWVVEARCPTPLFNVPIFGLDGRHIATPDLLDPVSGVAGEYDGSLHLVGAQRALDVGREGAVRRVGLELVTMVSGDRARPAGFIQRLHDAYARAERLAVSDRLWTLEQPRWWTDTSTVAARRGLTDAQRQTALTWRRTTG